MDRSASGSRPSVAAAISAATGTAAAGSAHAQRELDVFIGKWLTRGQTAARDGAEPAAMFASDIYEWGPERAFVVHIAYGRMGEADVGGLEVITPDAGSGSYTTHFFDSFGNVSVGDLTVRDRVWVWQGDRTRCNGSVSDDGRSLTAHHERSDDGVRWSPSMVVTLDKVD